MSVNFLRDTQQVMSFLVQQASHIEAEVVRIAYPDIQYPQLIPVDTSASEWAKSVTFFSMDKVGLAEWFHHQASDMAIADVNRAKHEHAIHMAGIGYRYTLEELGHAMMLRINLSSEKAEAARRAYEEFVDLVAISGDADKGMTGLINDANVTIVNAAHDGTAGSSEFNDKTSALIVRDINDLLTGVYTSSLTVEMADTILLPISLVSLLATKQVGDTTMTVMQWLQMHNVYTATTGQPLTIRGIRGLDTAGEGGVGRMVAYRRDPRVLKMHLPMPHRFLPVWQTGPITYDVPGIFRVGGVEIRRPGAVRYLDGVIDPAYA